MKRDELEKSIENFLLMTGMKPYRFGLEAMGDPNFVFELRKGRRCYEDTEKRLVKFMRAYRNEKPKRKPNKRAG